MSATTGETGLGTEAPTRQLVVLSLGSEEYGLPISRVHEIIRFVAPRWSGASEPWSLGVISLRGRIIAVHDLARRLGVAQSEQRPPQDLRIVIVDGGEPVGLVVDDVEEVMTISEDCVDHLQGARDAAVEAIARVGERLVVLLDPDGLLATAPAGSGEPAAEVAEAAVPAVAASAV